MEFNLLTFNSTLSNLKQKNEVEEHLRNIVKDIEAEFNFQSLGIYLKVPNSDIFRLKIARNISHTFVKNSIFTQADPMIEELKDLKFLDIHPPGRYIFEKSYTHLLILPIFYYSEMLGFMFIDKSSEDFDSEEIIKMQLFASVFAFIVKLDLLNSEFEQHKSLYESSKVYSYDTFLEKCNEIYTMMKRYERYLSIAVLTITNYNNMIRTIGKSETSDIVKQISYVIKNDLRETDIIGKIHEDEFAIIMPETSGKNCFITLERVQKRMAKLPLQDICIMGWGIASRTDKTKNALQLLHFAEHVAKETDRKEQNKINIHQ
ncbi:MAG: diguanylate cyclase [Candidatus Cloacimonetes bacterium]|nr:diguanylate cyclase [Candidatus Cloacimonadota bacterium]